MPRSTKTLDERIEENREKIRQLENQNKTMMQEQKAQERRDRDHRLCKRGAYLEKIVPDTISLTDEQFYQFLDKTLANDHARRALGFIKNQTGDAAGSKPPQPAQGNNDGNGAGSSVNTQGKVS